jgi:hypothetical protein
MALENTVEALSAKLHDIYQHEARRQGDVRHQEAYADLTESTKEFDRVLARFILRHASSASVDAMLADPLTSFPSQEVRTYDAL